MSVPPPSSQLEQAHILIECGAFSQARAVLQQILSAEPTNQEAADLLQAIAYQEGRRAQYDAAVPSPRTRPPRKVNRVLYWAAVPICAVFLGAYSLGRQGHRPVSDSLLAALIVTAMLLFCVTIFVAVGRFAESRGQSFWLGVILTLFLSPLVALVVLVCIRTDDRMR